MSDSASRARLARVAMRLGTPPILVTDDDRLPDPIAAAMALPRGSVVIVRARDPGRLRDLAQALRAVARARGLFLLVAGDVALAARIGADGVHLPAARIGEAAAIRARHRLIVTAAAHSLHDMLKAGAVDAVILSAVFSTLSHPGRPALGVLRANAIARLAPLPVYALGGITAENAARLSGFAGIAAIGALAGG